MLIPSPVPSALWLNTETGRVMNLGKVVFGYQQEEVRIGHQYRYSAVLCKAHSRRASIASSSHRLWKARAPARTRQGRQCVTATSLPLATRSLSGPTTTPTGLVLESVAIADDTALLPTTQFVCMTLPAVLVYYAPQSLYNEWYPR